MKTFSILICAMLFMAPAYAQETASVDQKITSKLSAVYSVLKSDPKIKQGLYQIRHSKSMALVSGMYTNDKKTGIWHYFDYKGTLVQNYNYDNNELTYLAPDPYNGIKYYFDKDLKETDKVTKPIRIGGWYYGFINYIEIFKKPSDILDIPNKAINIYLELLISPGGHLADYSIHLESDMYELKRTLNVNLNLLDEDDKLFVPATLNAEPVASRIIIPCKLDGKKIVFD